MLMMYVFGHKKKKKNIVWSFFSMVMMRPMSSSFFWVDTCTKDIQKKG